MERGQKKKNNKWLVVVLCALVVLIVGLVIGIITVNNNRAAEEDDQNSVGDDVIYFDTNMDGEELAEYNEYMDYYNEVRARVREIMNADSVDVGAVMKLYTEAITKYAARNGFSEVQAFVQAEKEDLLDGGFKREALDAMISVDYSYFPEPAQHRIYNDIIDLAKELGDAAVVAKYEPLAEATKEAFESSDRAIREAAVEFEGGEVVQGVE